MIALLMVPGISTGRALLAQAKPTATAPGAYVAVGGTYSYFQIDYGNRVLGGVGAFVDLNLRRQLGIEAEGRWLRQNQVVDVHETTYLIGPRVQIHRGRLAPYVKGLVGIGQINLPYNFGTDTSLALVPGGGLDVDVTDRIKLRLVDFEYQIWPQFSDAPGQQYGTLTPYGVSAGLSIQLFKPGWR